MERHDAEACQGHQCVCSCQISDGPGHSRSMAKLRTAMVGGCLVLNSYLLPLAFPDQSLAAELSAVAGAIILTLPIISTAFRDLLAGHVHMNELVALSILAAMTGGNFQMAGTIAFFLLLTIIIETRTASGARRSIEQLIRLTPPSASLLRDGVETSVDVSELEIEQSLLVRDVTPPEGVKLLDDPDSVIVVVHPPRVSETEAEEAEAGEETAEPEVIGRQAEKEEEGEESS